MGMIDRYKKKGGFLQLLNLIETTPPAKAEKFLSMIAEESPIWESEIRRKSLSIKRLATWSQTTLMELMPRLTPNVIGSAICVLPPEEQQAFLNALSHSEKRKVEDYLKETKPNSGESASCQMKFINEVRTMISQGALKLDKVDPDLVIPENIEDNLASGVMSSPASFEPAAHSSSAPAQASATSGAAPAGSSEELSMLRKKIVNMTQENQMLKQQLQVMKEKIDAVRKAAA